MWQQRIKVELQVIDRLSDCVWFRHPRIYLRGGNVIRKYIYVYKSGIETTRYLAWKVFLENELEERAKHLLEVWLTDDLHVILNDSRCQRIAYEKSQ